VSETKLNTAQLRRRSPFDALSDCTLQQVVNKTQLLTVPNGKMVFKREDERTQCHWLVKGAIDLVDEDYKTLHITDANDFARYMLDEKNHYMHTAVATDDCIFLVTDQDALDLALTVDQSVERPAPVADSDSPLAKERTPDTDDDWMSMLLQSRLFELLPPANIAALFQRFKPVSFPANSTVINQGDAGDFFYVVKEGELSVDREVDGKQQHLAKLKPGDLFGEEALFNDAPRNATIIMLTDGILMQLDKADFNTLLAEPASEYVTVKEVQAVIDAGEQTLIMIDVRFAGEFEHHHALDCINIPLQGLREAMLGLDKTASYVVTTEGRRGELAAFLMNQGGLDTFVLDHR
jgi:CRP-like cAMP-binding protein